MIGLNEPGTLSSLGSMMIVKPKEEKCKKLLIQQFRQMILNKEFIF